MAFTNTYMMNYRPSVLALNSDRSAARVAAHLIPNIYPHYRILDVGCGSGSVTLDLAALVPFGSVVGIDSNPRAIEAAKQSGNDRGLCNYEFRMGDAYRLEWEQGSFDAVHAHQYLVHLRDPAKALMEMKRVCKIGGVVAVRDADFATMTIYPTIPGYVELYENVIRSGGCEPYSGRRLIAWARAAGFERSDITVSASVEIHSSRHEREIQGNRAAERLLHSDLGKRAVGLGFATREEVLRMAEAWRRWIDDDDGYYSISHTEIICRKKTEMKDAFESFRGSVFGFSETHMADPYGVTL